ncbi:MAG: YceI family protein [Bacteroidota bacterium]|nr:YceI family protein [Bacteroidota bacterium]MDP4229940.1 YceI family protein [Bacteroidota bacterium]
MMKKTTQIFFLALAFCLTQASSYAQSKYFTKSGDITFDASGPLEDITAENKKATFVLDAKTGNVELAVLLKAFEFRRALMQEHFNENYVESDKYPKSTYKGKIDDFSKVDLSRDGSYPVKITGQLTIHGLTKDVPAHGTLIVKNGKVSGTAAFKIQLSDFDIEIPSLVKDKISNTVNIQVAVWLDPLP